MNQMLPWHDGWYWVQSEWLFLAMDRKVRLVMAVSRIFLCIIISQISSPGCPAQCQLAQGQQGGHRAVPALSSRPRGSADALAVQQCVFALETLQQGWLLLWAALRGSASVPLSGSSAMIHKLAFSQTRRSHVYLPADFLEHLEKFKMLFNVQIHEINFILKQ